MNVISDTRHTQKLHEGFVVTYLAGKNLKVTDCGRKESGLNEKNDCTVRAVAAALRTDYSTAHAMLAEAGRKPRRGIRFREPRVKSLGFVALPEYSCKTWKTVVKELPATGSFIVRVRHHVFAVVDGVVHDTAAIKEGKHVRMVYGLQREEA